MTRNDDPDARFQALYERRSRSVLAYFLGMGFPREDARELTQETFLRVFPHMKNIGETTAEEDAYVHTAAASVRANKLRKDGTKMRSAEEVSLDALLRMPTSTSEDLLTREAPANPEEELSGKQERAFMRKRLYRAICELPPEFRCPLLLQLAGLKLREIAEAMGISIDTVKTRHYHARKKLKEKIGENIEWPQELEDGNDRSQ